MKRRWKLLIGIVIALAGLLAANAIIVDRQTKPAEVTSEGGRILSLSGGESRWSRRVRTCATPGPPGLRSCCSPLHGLRRLRVRLPA
jgi:hypothetical protein